MSSNKMAFLKENLETQTESIFEEEIGGETVTILDTVDAIIFPPQNSAEVTKANATRIF